MTFKPYSKEKQTGKTPDNGDRMTKQEAVRKAKLDLAKATIAYKNTTTSYHSKNKDFRKKNKYGNKTTTYNGRTYHSIKEAQFAEELDWRKKKGEIKEIIPQFKISLDVCGKHITNYFIDFKIINADDSITFAEVKGFATSDWQLKWKLTEALLHQIEPGAELIVIR